MPTIITIRAIGPAQFTLLQILKMIFGGIQIKYENT